MYGRLIMSCANYHACVAKPPVTACTQGSDLSRRYSNDLACEQRFGRRLLSLATPAYCTYLVEAKETGGVRIITGRGQGAAGGLQLSRASRHLLAGRAPLSIPA